MEKKTPLNCKVFNMFLSTVPSTEAKGSVCDRACSEHGCWGPGPDMCLQCRSFQLDPEQSCLPSCTDQPLLFQADNKTCKHCHKQCAVGCTGPVSICAS